MKLESKYEVNAAHQLTAGVPEGHPCRRLHGHRYNITVIIEGPVDDDTGMILEYAEIDRRVNGVLSYIDHHFINELEKAYNAGNELREKPLAIIVSKNSTVENLVRWLKAELKHRFDLIGPHKVHAVRIEEDAGHTVEL